MPQQLPEMLDRYAHRNTARFHMPGHKGRGMGGFFSRELANWDITELSFSDDLQNPSASIQKAQELYAARYGAKHTFFLVNGSTAGLLALLLSLPRGANVLIGRDCHRAVISGIALAGHRCSFLSPAVNTEHSLHGSICADALREALSREHFDAVCITSPNYYGLCADLSALYAATRAHGTLLFVDAAHGAHFPFSQLLPDTPSGCADAWVNSAHKTLNALGQSALLHIGPNMDLAAVQRALSMVQTSSPSYLLLASLDWARYTADLAGAWSKAVQACTALREELSTVLGIVVPGKEIVGTAGIADIDFTRLTLDVHARGITGFAAQRLLEAQNVFVEMADYQRLVCICTPSDDPAWYPMLHRALEKLPYGMPHKKCAAVVYPAAPRDLPLHEAARAAAISVPLTGAAGRIAAECAGVYPPGIPLVTPGERITQECIDFLLEEQACGASLFGVHDGNVAVVSHK
ncbi:hypothetical protein LJC07_08380 [Christensenellaceae bacterium OttesenSCG-928-L17]|nr:hypothetical protein [Christensenellaceae bacterium OttesenSCG-928-L17]